MYEGESMLNLSVDAQRGFDPGQMGVVGVKP